MVFGLNQAQSNFQELVRCSMKSDAAYTNLSDEVAEQCADASVPL